MTTFACVDTLFRAAASEVGTLGIASRHFRALFLRPFCCASRENTQKMREANPMALSAPPTQTRRGASAPATEVRTILPTVFYWVRAPPPGHPRRTTATSSCARSTPRAAPSSCRRGTRRKRSKGLFQPFRSVPVRSGLVRGKVPEPFRSVLF